MSLHSNHPYHLVENSPWPLTASLGAMMLTTGLVNWFYTSSILLLLFGFLCIFFSSYQWWRDISREGCYQGLHTLSVVSGLRMGMILFIVSEICFFFSFFWSFFHSSLNPVMDIGSCWPPTDIVSFNCFHIPLLNTAILLSSGVTVTWSHHATMSGNHSQSILGLVATIVLGFYFTLLQGYEYAEASFCISDSVYGSTFFVATGFHGLHVIIGSVFLFICLIRMYLGHFSSNHHMGYEASIWYWHFVDVVWLFLYITIYWWGG